MKLDCLKEKIDMLEAELKKYKLEDKAWDLCEVFYNPTSKKLYLLYQMKKS